MKTPNTQRPHDELRILVEWRFASLCVVALFLLSFCAADGGGHPRSSESGRAVEEKPSAVGTPVAHPSPESLPSRNYGYRIVKAYPHDSGAFTQGLEFHEGTLYEGTGRYGRSELRKLELESGEVLERVRLLPDLFGEGITIFGDRIYQLTWQSRVGFIYDVQSMSLIREFRYGIEGWGMTHDEDELIVSDGSDMLYFWDPETLRETKRLEVRDQGRPVRSLNELEYIKGEIYANIWQRERIARISPKTGEVLAWIDVSGLYQELDPGEDVLNGIAYIPDGDRLFVTGKLWPQLFEIELVEKDGSDDSDDDVRGAQP